MLYGSCRVAACCMAASEAFRAPLGHQKNPCIFVSPLLFDFVCWLWSRRTFEDIDASTPIVSDIPNGKPLEYPKLYVGNDLPEDAGAIVTRLGRQLESLKDGVAVTAVSNDSIGLIMSFYIEAMEKLGGTFDSNKYERSQLVADTLMSMVVFTKEKFDLV